MSLFLSVLLILTVFFGMVFLFLLSNYNLLIRLRNRVRTDFSDIEVQLRRRGSLVQTLVDMVREYAKHENDTFKGVAAARSALERSTTPGETAKADNMLTETLRSLMMVTEAYPELRASENFQQLRQDILRTEDQIATYRETYNKTVERFNNVVQTFPSLLVANLFSFSSEALFQQSSSEAYQLDADKKPTVVVAKKVAKKKTSK
ncbi:LemA family protein [Candidatus Woesebacteria bacterium]|nr:LemA family protein [Candidatus Woesebacteria bacterium]